MKSKMRAKRLALLGILSAAALVLSYVESLIAIFPVPGMKIGLGNVAVMAALYATDIKDAAIVAAVKAAASCFLFSGIAALLYTLCGCVLSFGAMLAALKLKGSEIGVSISGSLFHNIGQLAAAAILLTPKTALAYSPMLILSGLIMGAVTGICVREVNKTGVLKRRPFV